MNKKLLVLIIVLGALILTLFGSWLMWITKTERTLNVYILDKTVPTMDRTEHKSFNWILDHNRFVKPNGDLYYEQLFGTVGFDGMSTNSYHEHRPTQVKEIKRQLGG